MLQIASFGETTGVTTTTTTRVTGAWPTPSGGHHRNRGGRHRGKSKVMEAIDLFLEGMGLYRKQTARDATCLFRAVSEQVFYSQCFHYSVRLSCIHFMERNRALFPDSVDGEDFGVHIRRMRNPREWGGHWEMQAMSILYKKDFVIFNDINTAPVQVTDNKFADKILLCRIGSSHFDSVFTKEFIDSSGICQGLLYELLYGKVFGMEDIDTAVQVMLYEGKQNKDGFEVSTISRSLKESHARPNSVVNVIVKGGTPFPYKVAKALDPRLYRNVEYDLWNDERKDIKKSSIFHNEILQIGSKCMVTINGNPNHRYPAYIQDMQPDKGPVTVFVEVLGEKCTVPYENIEPIVLPSLTKARCIYISGTQALQSTSQSIVRFRRLKTTRLADKGTSSQREITQQISDKIQHCALPTKPKARQVIDFNNNKTVNQTTMIWSHTTSNLSSSPESTSSSLDSRDSRSSMESEPQKNLPILDSPYYLTMSPPSTLQFGGYPPIPSCPPPAVSYAPPPPPQHQQQQSQQQQQQVIPMPMYVTFSDGVTIVVPASLTGSVSPSQQSPPQVIYQHYQDTSNAPPPATYCPPPAPFSTMMNNMDHYTDNNMSLEHQQFLVHHQEDSRGIGLYEGHFNMMTLPPGYWPSEQQQQQITIPSTKHLNSFMSTNPYCTPPQQMLTNPLGNGETGSIFYFSPPFPYHHHHQMSN